MSTPDAGASRTVRVHRRGVSVGPGWTLCLLLFGCSGGSDLIVDRDVEALSEEVAEQDVAEDVDGGIFEGCNPLTAAGCMRGERCTPDVTGALVCVPAGPGEIGDRCSAGLESQCGVGLLCVRPDQARPCCSQFCQTPRDCADGACVLIATTTDGTLGYCAGVCPPLSATPGVHRE